MKEINYEKFYGKIWKTGSGFVITIPSSLIKFGGYNVDDEVVVMMKKEKKKGDANEKEESKRR